VPVSSTMTVPQLAKLYDFPAGLDGTGQKVGILEFGGIYRKEDLRAYLADLDASGQSTKQTSTTTLPSVRTVEVGGAKQALDGAQGEVSLDVEIIAALCPNAEISLYFSSFTTQGWVAAIRAATSDPAHTPSVLLVDWGLGEGQDTWTKDGMEQVNEALHAAADSGVTIVAASGEDGAGGALTDGQPHVLFPASSPWVLSVGGTTLGPNGVATEKPWNQGVRSGGGGSTGGGVSQIFPLPAWQAVAHIPPRPGGFIGRGVPDVAAAASYDYQLVIDGRRQANGGTSASAALWAGLITLLNQGLGRNIGYFNPELYSDVGPAGVLHNVIGGDNGAGKVKGYQCVAGWNPCTGWGSPDGVKLLEHLRAKR
jgi:kumamolisin